MQTAPIYIPILRWKAAEREALKTLPLEVKSCISPLVELLHQKHPGGTIALPLNDEQLKRIVRELYTCWVDPCLFGSCSNRIFIDFHHLSPHVGSPIGNRIVQKTFLEANLCQLPLTPVVGLTSTPTYKRSIKGLPSFRDHGLLLRVSIDDLPNSRIESLITSTTKEFGLPLGSIDLLIDYGFVSKPARAYQDICSIIPQLTKWRSFIVSGGAFPEDLAKFPQGLNKCSRDDWLTWRDQVSQPLPRMPLFSDYTIQHPTYREPPENANVSASIRYTIDEDWAIMRGRGLRTDDSGGSRQYPANAQLLCQELFYCGPKYSYGDQYIYEKSDIKIMKPGNPKEWLRAGFNHHMTFVVRQVASFLDKTAAV